MVKVPLLSKIQVKSLPQVPFATALSPTSSLIKSSSVLSSSSILTSSTSVFSSSKLGSSSFSVFSSSVKTSLSEFSLPSPKALSSLSNEVSISTKFSWVKSSVVANILILLVFNTITAISMIDKNFFFIRFILSQL